MATTETTRVAWFKGCKIKHKPTAEMAFEELNRIKDTNEGRITPILVLEEARNEDSPIHPCFEWSDTKAADLFRLHQAREIISSIRIVEGSGDKREERIAFISVIDKEGQAYQPREVVAVTPQLQSSALALALRHLEGLQKRYSDIQELSGVWEEMRRVRERVPDSKSTS